VRLNLLARLLHLLRKVLLEEGRGDRVLLRLGLGGRDGGLRYRCGHRGRSRSRGWLNDLHRLLCWRFYLRNGSDTFWLWRWLRFGLFGFRSWFTVGSVSRHA